ncbi:PorP/SprF family type IX secretion system membrane protein [Emticicia fontis]
MKIRISIKLLFLLIGPYFLSTNIYAQEPQFSQLYANPLFLNPARAGYEQSVNSNNAGVNLRFAFRKQWPQLSSSFSTATTSIDGYDESTNLGFGAAFIHDQQGDFMKQEGVRLFLSSHLPLGKKGDFLHLGSDVSFHHLNYSTNGLIFMDQLTGGGISPTSIDPLAQLLYQKNYLNAGVGGILELRSDDNKLFFIGASAHNLTKPDLAFRSVLSAPSQEKTTIPTLWGLELGFQKAFHLANKTGLGNGNNRWSSFSANAYFKKQRQSMQLDLGIVYNFDMPFMLGFYYRGIPIRRYNDIIQQDAVVGMVGIVSQYFSLRYSCDFVISTLRHSGGSHEVVLSFNFGSNLDLLARRNQRRQLDCVKFQH